MTTITANPPRFVRVEPHRTSRLKQFWVHARLEAKSFWSTPGSVAFIVALPVAMYVIFGLAYKSQSGVEVPLGSSTITMAARSFAGMLTFGLFTVAFNNTAIGMAMKRTDGRFRRLRVTAASPLAVVGAALVSWVVLALILVLVLSALAIWLFGVHIPAASVAPMLGYGLLGTAAFMALGFAVSLLIPSGESAPAVANIIMFPMIMLSGVFGSMPIGDLGTRIVGWLPVRPLMELFSAGLAQHPSFAGWDRVGVLAAWTLSAVLFSLRHFRWSSEKEYSGASEKAQKRWGR